MSDILPSAGQTLIMIIVTPLLWIAEMAVGCLIIFLLCRAYRAIAGLSIWRNIS